MLKRSPKAVGRCRALCENGKGCVHSSAKRLHSTLNSSHHLSLFSTTEDQRATNTAKTAH